MEQNVEETKTATEASPSTMLDIEWPRADTTSVPYQVFYDPGVFELEQKRIFEGPTWSYVGLEAEVALPGDFKATFVGKLPVVVSRDSDGVLHVFVNRCAHRGAMVCRELRGNRAAHTCIYHQWTYNQRGDLIGVPFRKGVNKRGGYGANFDTTGHSLQKLRVETYNGLIFVSFSDSVESLRNYLGPDMRRWLDRIFNRPIQLLGYARQFIHANWKLYAENVKDPYHASLLHLFHTTFGIYRSSQGGGVTMDEERRHSMLRAFKRNEEEETKAYKGENVRSYKSDYYLADPSLLTSREELAPPLTNHIQMIFPSLVVQQIQNTLATRHILPKEPGKFELIFSFFGYEDDDDEIRKMRIKQANLVGPAGYISMEDGYAAELVQDGIAMDSINNSFLECGGTGTDNEENLLTESAIRGYWRYYREIMGFDQKSVGQSHSTINT